MTFAELLSTVEHVKQQLDAKGISYHKVLLTVVPVSGQRQELYPGSLKQLDKEQLFFIGRDILDAPVLEFEAE